MSAEISHSDHGDHDHPDFLAHHFDTPKQQYESAKFGMWLFLLTEMLMFSGLFLAYVAFRYWHPELFVHASRMLDLKMGTVNTVVLITSSFTMALAVRAAQMSNQRMQIIHLTLTFLFAGAFMVVKYFEYSHKIHVGTLPGVFFHPDPVNATFLGADGLMHNIAEIPNARIFFGIYFIMTGLHGFHVLCGMGVIGWLIWRACKNEFCAEYYTPVENVGLYWHIVDLIWIFLFPLLYLVDRT